MANYTPSERLETAVRGDILHSWLRCQTIGLNPGQQKARTALTSFQLEELLSGSDLYRVAKPIIDNIYGKLAGTGYLVTLNDENGRMIYLKGDSDIIKKAEKFNFYPGMDWSEEAAGTNAIGTSIISKKPIQVVSAEHFCEGFHPMTCSSSPIVHPYTKTVIGAIDFTGFWPSTQPHTLGLAASLAHLVEQELILMYKKRYLYLEDYYTFCKNKWKGNPILIISKDVIIVDGDPQLMSTLKITKMNPHPKIDQLQGMDRELLEEAEQQGFLFETAEPIIYNQEDIGAVVIFKHKLRQDAKFSHVRKSPPIIGSSPSIRKILQKCEPISSIDAPILITGETGTGKELIAKYVHDLSPRREMPFIPINCGAIQKELISSELFGYDSGTFTGGKKEGKKGKFEEADGGTIFLDEIGEMPLDLQVHLLRVLQEREFTRLGSAKPIKTNVKVIAATNRSLESMIEEGRFRKDLFYRLNVISLKVPSLRERKDDIIPITNYYINKFTKKYDKPSVYLTERTKDFFLNYSWPGNIRELRNAIEHAVIFSNSHGITKEDLPDYIADLKAKQRAKDEEHGELSPIEKAEMEQIKQLLLQTDWNISSVSKKLNIARSTLYRKLRKYNLKEHEQVY